MVKSRLKGYKYSRQEGDVNSGEANLRNDDDALVALHMLDAIEAIPISLLCVN